MGGQEQEQLATQCRVAGPACRDPDTPMCLVPTANVFRQVAGTHQGTQNRTQHRGLFKKVQNLFATPTPWVGMMLVHISEGCKRHLCRRFLRYCSDGRFMHLQVGSLEALFLSRSEAPCERILVVRALFRWGKMRLQDFVALFNKFSRLIRNSVSSRVV